MRSPFDYVRRSVCHALDLGERRAQALDGILETMRALGDAVNRFEARESANPLPDDDIRLVGLATRIDDLTVAVSEGVNNVQRSERRVRAVVTSARRQLAEAGFEHPGLEAENGELRELDGKSGNGEPVPAVPETVDTSGPDQPSVIPGISMRQMQVARSRRR